MFYESTHSLPITGVQFTDASKIERAKWFGDGSQVSDIRTIELNALAQSTMFQYNIPFIDTWSITYHVSELSHDGVHYHPNGPIGQALLLVVRHYLCLN